MTGGGTVAPASLDESARALLAALAARGETVATAESLTGGSLCAALTAISGASATVRGGVVAYATPVKQQVLGVDATVLARPGGAVQAQVAEQMATGVRRILGADVGIATTGVAGPTEQDGQPVGRVFVAVAGPDGVHSRRLDLPGERDEVRRAAVLAALELTLERIGRP